MSYSTSISELRQLLGDSDMHKKATKKRLIGDVDGTNLTYFAYDKRLFEDTVEVFVKDSTGSESSVSFTLDDAVKGQITLSSSPDVNSKVVANYYWQFWTDAEIKNFLNKGAEATGVFTDILPDDSYLKIQAGLRAAALLFAAHLATQSLIQYEINRRHSEEFLVEESGNSDNGFTAMISALRGQAKDYWDRAIFHRDDFYKRLGKRNAPSFGIKSGSTRRYGANR